MVNDRAIGVVRFQSKVAPAVSAARGLPKYVGLRFFLFFTSWCFLCARKKREGWEVVDLNAPPLSLPHLFDASSPLAEEDENGSWVEVIEMLVPSAERLEALLDATQQLWVTACVPIGVLPAPDTTTYER